MHTKTKNEKKANKNLTDKFSFESLEGKITKGKTEKSRRVVRAATVRSSSKCQPTSQSASTASLQCVATATHSHISQTSAALFTSRVVGELLIQHHHVVPSALPPVLLAIAD
jgi:hypothetical protein